MDDQEWRTHARRHAPPRTNQDGNGVGSPRAGTQSGGLSAPTIASSNKSILRQREPRQNGNGKTPNGSPATSAPVLGPTSRWKEMRQAVRIKATIDTEDRRASNARIADLCEEDRDKVAKLIRRIVEVGALHDESETEFERQRAVMESEIGQLRGDAKRDAHEIDELSEKLKDALLKVRDYQERVLVLEESNELEMKHRMETDQTMHLLKVEVGKLRKLVKKQKEEMETKETEQQRKHREEMGQMAAELKEAQEQLLHERKERLLEKQKELDERIHRSAVASPPAPAPAHPPVASGRATTVNETNKYDQQVESSHTPTPGWASTGRAMDLDASSFFNISADMPDKIKEIMTEWKTRMEEALAGAATSVTQETPLRRSVSTAACQTERDGQKDERSLDEDGQADEDEEYESPTHRRPHHDSQHRRHTSSSPRQRTQQQQTPPPLSTPHRHPEGARRHGVDQPLLFESDGYFPSRIEPRQRWPRVAPPHSQQHENQRVTRALVSDFDRPSVLANDSFDDEVDSSIALMNGVDMSPMRSTHSAPRNLSLYESSLLDVVDAIESSAVSSVRDLNGADDDDVVSSMNDHHHGGWRRTEQQDHVESPTMRVEQLMEGLRVREQRLAQVAKQLSPRRQESSSLEDDIKLLNELYEERLQQEQREQEESDNDNENDQDYDDDDDQRWGLYE